MSLPPPPPAGRLTAGERAVLAFARAHPGRCTDPQVRAGLGMSATAYYQRLLALLDRAEAAAAAPALIARLRADRDRRRAWRTLPEHTPPHHQPHRHPDQTAADDEMSGARRWSGPGRTGSTPCPGRPGHRRRALPGRSCPGPSSSSTRR